MTDDYLSLIKTALAEDIGSGDITSRLTIPESAQGEMRFVARAPMVACGAFFAAEVYRQITTSPSPLVGEGGERGMSPQSHALKVPPLPNPLPQGERELDKYAVTVELLVAEGAYVATGTILATAKGNARALLAGERVALNLMQRACGVASLTRRYVEAVAGTKAIILDTRKTMPGMRALDKYAVKTGGGENHRFGLYDMVLIKDNHIALCGGVTAAVAKARAGTDSKIVVECDTLLQVEEALAAKPDRILLDNMTLENLRAAVKLSAGRMKLEASGGVNLDTVRAIAETGVDYISVGALTHSAPAADIGGDVVIG